MKSEQEIEVLKENLQDYLIWKTCDDWKKPHYCINPMHKDDCPSMSYDCRNKTLHCFGCGASYDIYQVVEIMENIDKAEAFKFVINRYGNGFNGPNATLAQNQERKADDIRAKDYSDDFILWHKALLENEQPQSYLRARGISLDTAKQFKLGYCPDYYLDRTKKASVIIFPTTKNSYTTRNISDSQNASDRIRKKGSSNVFNRKALENSIEYCIVTEGEFDCLSFIELGFNAIALGGVGNAKKFLTLAKDKEKAFILALDNDSAGEKSRDTIAEGLKRWNKQVYVLDYGNTKDPNEALLNDKSHLITQCEKMLTKIQNETNQREKDLLLIYEQNNCQNKLADLKRYIEKTKSFRPYATGFSMLDNVLNGGLNEGLYIIGGMSSLGKTTFTMQIADNIAKSGNDVIIFSLEMSRIELMSKSISRLTFEDNPVPLLPKTANEIQYGYRYQIFSESELNHIEFCMTKYQDFGKHLYVFENGQTRVQEIRNSIKKHVDITHRKPVAIVDYLQILASPNKNLLTDKQIADINVSELKRLSREFEIPIVVISSLNRQSYSEPINMSAFKESGGIEYSADVLIGLQLKGVGEKNFDINEAKAREPREIEAVILKNRSGQCGKNIAFEYVAKYNYFKDSESYSTTCALNQTKIKNSRNKNLF